MSSGGFVCWFDEIFAPENLDKCYIIKGGSGTGKSSLMRKVTACAEKNRYDVEMFLCSSDPTSLDGIILTSPNGRKIAFFDGTSPHTRDPKFPGAVEEIINLGTFWNADKLRMKRDEICAIAKYRSQLYQSAGEYFHAAGEIEKLLRYEAKSKLLHEKLEAAAKRFISRAIKEAHIKPAGKEGKVSIRCISALSTMGAVRLDSFESAADHLAVISNVMGTAPFMMDALLRQAVENRLDVVRSPMPLEPQLTEALLIPDLSLAIITQDPSSDGYCDDSIKLINMARFIDKDSLDPDEKKRRRTLKKCSRELISGGLAHLADVRAAHADMEKIYIDAMDFNAVNNFSKKLLAVVFSDKN